MATAPGSTTYVNDLDHNDLFLSSKMDFCATFQSLDPEIDAQIKARYRDKFMLDSDAQHSQQPQLVSPIHYAVLDCLMFKSWTQHRGRGSLEHFVI